MLLEQRGAYSVAAEYQPGYRMYPDVIDGYPFHLDTVQPAVRPVAAVAAKQEILLVVIGTAIDSLPSVVHHAP